MRIDRVELRLVGMELKQPFTTSFGTLSRKEFILVTVFVDGLLGYGEVAALPAPLYSYETTGTAWLILEQFLVPLVLGREWSHPSELPAWWKHLRGHAMAKCGLEQAAWCAWAEAQGVPLAAALGGTRGRVEVGVSIGIQREVGDLLRAIEGYLARGYRRIKIKIKPGWDVGVVREVRRQFGGIPLMVDANSAYTLADAAHLEGLDDFGLMMIEQPLDEDDLVDHAALQRRLRTPICLDESITGPEAGRRALELGSCRIINIKVGRVGGPTAARALHDLARAQAVPVWCGGMLESGIGRAHNLALASLPGFTLPGDISASDRYWHRDLVDPPVTMASDGTIPVPNAPGLGFTVDGAYLESLTLKKAQLP